MEIHYKDLFTKLLVSLKILHVHKYILYMCVLPAACSITGFTELCLENKCMS